MINTSYIVLFFLAISFFTLGQQTDFLIQKKDKIEEEINIINAHLEVIKEDKKNNLTTLSAFQKEIELRKALIDNIEQDVDLINNSLDLLIISLRELTEKEDSINTEIKYVEKRILHIDTLYMNSIKQIYLSKKSENLLYLIISTSSFDNAMNQYLYLKTIKRSIKSLGEKKESERLVLKNLQNDLHMNREKMQIDSLNQVGQKRKKEDAIIQKETEAKKLKNNIKNKEKLINDLSIQIKSLETEALEKQKNAEKIENEIRNLNNQNKDLDNNNLNFDLLNTDFEKQKGILSWPVENCVIMSSFGTVYHKELPGIKVVNNGIELAVHKNSLIKSVFSGVVSKIVVLPSALKAVIIRHGGYSSVYTNLGELYVQQGDIIIEKGNIGKVYTKENHKTGLMEFQIWRGTDPLNPKIWLKNIN